MNRACCKVEHTQFTEHTLPHKTFIRAIKPVQRRIKMHATVLIIRPKDEVDNALF